MKRKFYKGDLAILIDVYALCLEYDMERYIETSDWHEKICIVIEKIGGRASQGYRVMRDDGSIEYANQLFLFDPEEYYSSTYEELYAVTMRERNMDEKIRWRKHTKTKDVGNNGQTPLN